MCDKSDLKIAWAAGVFEGEGCIHIDYVKGRKYPSLGLSVTMTDEDVVQEFSLVVGVNKVYSVNPSTPSNKLQYRWKTNKRTEVERILLLFLPHLGHRRLEKAQEALNTPSSGIRWGEGNRAGESATYRKKRNERN